MGYQWWFKNLIAPVRILRLRSCSAYRLLRNSIQPPNVNIIIASLNPMYFWTSGNLFWYLREVSSSGNDRISPDLKWEAQKHLDEGKVRSRLSRTFFICRVVSARCFFVNSVSIHVNQMWKKCTRIEVLASAIEGYVWALTPSPN